MRLDTIDITDYDQLAQLRDYIEKEQPLGIKTTRGGLLTSVQYGEDSEGWPYADIGVCLPDNMCVVLEGHAHINNATVGALQAIRIWLEPEEVK